MPYDITNFKAYKNTQWAANSGGGITSENSRNVGEAIADSFWNNVSSLQGMITATGTDTYAVTGGITSYASGFMIVVKFTNASTAAATLNVNGLGVKKIMVTPTTQAGSGDIIQNRTYIFIYDSALDAAAGAFLILGSGSINSIDGGSL